uniref:Head to tail connecting protein n=1 Tax=uncultured marine virus TaxID=186617 RepID=A0A0F7L7J7_9VIRU|nr:head to tail connecting protein [uncultured marine virus]
MLLLGPRQWTHVCDRKPTTGKCINQRRRHLTELASTKENIKPSLNNRTLKLVLQTAKDWPKDTLHQIKPNLNLRRSHRGVCRKLKLVGKERTTYLVTVFIQLDPINIEPRLALKSPERAVHVSNDCGLSWPHVDLPTSHAVLLNKEGRIQGFCPSV